MFIAVRKDTNIFTGRSERLEKWDNGYPLFPDLNRAYVPEFTEIYNVDSIPAVVVEHQYCYTPEKGFYPNPNYTEE